MIKVKGSGGSTEIKKAVVEAPFDTTTSPFTGTITGLDFTPLCVVLNGTLVRGGNALSFGNSIVCGWSQQTGYGSTKYESPGESLRIGDLLNTWDLTNIQYGGFSYSVTTNNNDDTNLAATLTIYGI